MVTIKYFVHGTTTDNLTGKCTGWQNGELSPKGIQQGIDLAHTIKDQHFDIVFCSDLTRAIESAKLNFYNRDIKIKKDKRIRECNYGDYTGQGEKLVYYPDYINKRFPNGESLKDVQKRIESFCRMLKQKHDGKTVAIVAHRSPQLALDVITNKKTWEQALKDDWRNEKKWQPGWEYKWLK